MGFPEKEEIEKTLVEYEGFFHYGRLYQYVYDLLSSYDYKVYETQYLKDLQDGVIQIKWQALKDMDNYTRFEIDVRFWYGGFEKGKTRRGGKTVEMEKGDMEVHLSSYLITDYLGRWERNPILRNLKWIYERYIYKDVIDSYDEKITEEFWDIAGRVKDFFELERT